MNIKPITLFILLCLALASVSFGLQLQSAVFQFTRRSTGATQQEADRKLAAYLAAYAEARGKSGLCVVAGDGACLRNAQDEIVYDLALVAAAIESILDADLNAAARDRFTSGRVEAERVKAVDDFEKGEKPSKAGVSVPRRPNQ